MTRKHHYLTNREYYCMRVWATAFIASCKLRKYGLPVCVANYCDRKVWKYLKKIPK